MSPACTELGNIILGLFSKTAVQKDNNTLRQKKKSPAFQELPVNKVMPRQEDGAVRR